MWVYLARCNESVQPTACASATPRGLTRSVSGKVTK